MTHGHHLEPIQQIKNSDKSQESSQAKRAARLVDRLREAQEYGAAAMASAQQAMEEQANRSRAQAPLFRVGDKVWLNLKNIQTPQPKKKLAWVNAKYTVMRVISPHVVELDVPSKIWPHFHVQLLRLANDDPLPSQVKDDSQPPPVLPDNLNGNSEPEQFVERILRAEKMRRGRGWVRKVLVKWHGFAEPNWEERSALESTIALDEFEATYGKGDGVGCDEGGRQGIKSRRGKRG